MTSQMKYDFIKDIVSKREEEEPKAEAPSGSFKLGFALGMAAASAAFIALEVGALYLALLLFGVSLTFWQGLAIILAYKYLVLQLRSGVDS